MLLHHKRCIDIMDHSSVPKKKLRLDNDYNDWDNDDAEGNDELWGHAELTAEEFDFLEVQASQCLQADSATTSTNNNDSGYNISKTSNQNASKSKEDNEMRKKQYALEGQVKMLSDSLDKAFRELNQERLNRDQIITSKLEEYKLKQQDMQKEIDKLQTALHFKEQEIKTAHSNAHLNNIKGRDPGFSQFQQQFSSSPCRSPNNQFLSRFCFKKSSVSLTEAAVQTVGQPNNACEVLNLFSNQGKPKGSEIASRLLYNKKDSNYANQTPSVVSSASNLLVATLPNIAKLNIYSDVNDLWHSYDACLKQHLSFLQTAAQRQNPVLLKKIKRLDSHIAHSSITKQRKSSFEEEMEKQHHMVISCLKDISELLLFQCPKEGSNTSSPPLSSAGQESSEQAAKVISEAECLGGFSNPLFAEDDKMDVIQKYLPCLSPVLNLANFETYPDWYYFSQSEMEYALIALAKWSSQNVANLAPVIHSLPLQSLVAGQQGYRCATMTLQTLSNMVQTNCLQLFIHQMGSCLFSSVADFCHTITISKNHDHLSTLNVIQNFLCTAITIFGKKGLEDERCPCSTQLTQSFIMMLWKCYRNYSMNSSVTTLNLLRKGVVALHQLSTHVKNFREKRLPVEDHYMNLVCGVSRLSKMNDSPLAIVADNIHELWDFQEDNDETEERISD